MRKKIAVIAPGKLPLPCIRGGAIETLFTHLLNENERRGYLQFEVFCYGDEESIQAARQYSNSSFFIFKYSIKDWLYDKIWAMIYKASRKRILARTSLARRSLRVLKRCPCEFVLIEGNYLQVCQLHSLNIPIIYHLHTDILNDRTPCCKKIISDCYKILVISEFLKKQIQIAANVTDKVIVYKNAIDTKSFISGKPSHLLRDRLGISRDDKIAIFVGRVVRIKGVFEMVKAFHDAAIPNLSLLIVGGSSFADSQCSAYENEIRKYVSTNNLKVFFIGYIPQIQLPQYYALADFSICPSVCNEAAGLVIVEAQSCGLPVIASMKGGIPEYVYPGSSILIECNDCFVSNLSSAIRRMYVEYIERGELLRHGSYNKDYSIENYYDKFRQIVNSMCNESSNINIS